MSQLKWKTCILKFWLKKQHCSRSFVLVTIYVTFNKSFNHSGLQFILTNKKDGLEDC